MKRLLILLVSLSSLGLLVLGLVFLTSGSHAPENPAEDIVSFVMPSPTVIDPIISGPMAKPPVVRSEGGYVVSVIPWFADGNRVVVSYTVEGPADRFLDAFWLGHPLPPDGSPDRISYFNYGGPVLREASGVGLPALNWGVSAIEGGDLFVGQPKPQRLLAFDSSAIEYQFSTLDLTMTADLLVNRPPHSEDVFGPTYRPHVETEAKNLVFSFSLPLDRTLRRGDVHQTVTAGTIALTLDSVVVSNSETRLIMSAVAQSAYSPVRDWQPRDMTIRVGDYILEGHWLDYPLRGLGVESSKMGSWISHFPGALLDKGGDWDVVIGALVSGVTDDHYVIDEGPWHFHFSVPQPGTP